ncbi:MAG: CHRD domain-containing protein, partial [Janthinobacterium lividum]
GATLTPAQLADLQAGKYYYNIHTATNPGGEIRGQLVRAQ